MWARYCTIPYYCSDMGRVPWLQTFYFSKKGQGTKYNTTTTRCKLNFGWYTCFEIAWEICMCFHIGFHDVLFTDENETSLKANLVQGTRKAQRSSVNIALVSPYWTREPVISYWEFWYPLCHFGLHELVIYVCMYACIYK